MMFVGSTKIAAAIGRNSQSGRIINGKKCENYNSGRLFRLEIKIPTIVHDVQGIPSTKIGSNL